MLRRQRRPISAGQRFRVLKRDNFRCRYCGSAPSDGTVLHVDHVVPVVKGGTNDDRNLVAACTDCNLGKYTSDAEPPEGAALPPPGVSAALIPKDVNLRRKINIDDVEAACRPFLFMPMDRASELLGIGQAELRVLCDAGLIGMVRLGKRTLRVKAADITKIAWDLNAKLSRQRSVRYPERHKPVTDQDRAEAANAIERMLRL